LPIFYFHPQNEIPKKLAEMTRSKGFMHTNRPEFEFKLQTLFAELGIDLWPTFHTVLGSLPGTIISHMKQQPNFFDPDNEMDKHTMKVCKVSPTPWAWVKVVNGPQMNFIVGYSSMPALNPYNMTPVQAAQRGIVGVSHLPASG
jgi:hypothetical protein